MITTRPSPGAEGPPVCVTDTLIIGAGPSELAAACRLVEAGLLPVIVEKSTTYGGLMRSMRHGSFVVDLGRKELYSRIPEVDTLWSNLLNSRVARAQYSAFGYMTGRTTVIPNGFDSAHFRPRHDARTRLMSLFRMDGWRPIIGMVARNHPMKDPATLINAMRRLWATGQEADLLIVGPGMEKLADGARISGDRITLSGARDDLAEWLPGLDLLVLPSAWGEAFPNIIGEAMASGVTCVATDVGDSQWIIGEHGLVVPPGTPEAMQAAIAKLLQLSPDARRALGLAGRARVIQQFSLPAIAQDYATLYGSVVDSWQSRVIAGVPLGSAEFT